VTSLVPEGNSKTNHHITQLDDVVAALWRILMKKLSLIGFVAVAALVVFAAQVQAQTTIADWTFETSQPTAAGPFSPEVGAGSATGSHAGAAVYSSPAGNGSSHSFSSNIWAVGDYYQFQVSTLNLTNIGIQWDQVSSNTGPGNMQLFWSTDNSTFTAFGAQQTILANAAPNPLWNASTSNSMYTFTYATSIGATVAAINNAATVYFRIQDSSTTSANGGAIAAGGTDRVDNVIITGLANPVYFAGSSLGVGTGGASNVWDNTSSNWSQSNTGSPHVAYTNSGVSGTNIQPALFQGTAGNVTASSVVSKGGVIFNATGYTISGSTITLDTSASSSGNSINVANGASATISSQLLGSQGLNKTGLGTLILNPASSEGFTGGDYTLTQGILQASTPSQLGSYGSLVLSGGTLQFTSGAGTSFTFDPSAHAIKGTSGGFSLPANSTMTINGVVGADTATGPQLTLSGAGSTLNLANATAPAVGGIVFADPATLKVSNSGTLFLFGNVNDVASGTSTIDIGTGGQIQFATPASSFNAVQSDGTLVIKGDLISHKAVSYGGAGTIDIQGNNIGWDTGTATIGSSNSTGPTVLVHDSNALGTADATRGFHFNSGELNASAPVTFGQTLSIGAFGSANPAVFSGSDITFGAAGGIAPVNVFKGASTSATPSQVRFEVDNHVTFAGGWGAATDNTAAPFGTLNAVIIQGTGKLTVNGNASGNILEDLPLITETSATVEVNGVMKKDDSTPWTTLNSAPSFTLGSRSKLKNMASGNLPAASNMIFGYSASGGQNIYGGTYQNNGTTQSLNTIKVDAATDALQSSLSTIDMGGAGSLSYAASAGGWATGATLRVTNWQAGDPLKIGTSASLTTAEKAAIHFQGYATGSTQAGDGTVTPIGSKIYFLGDASQDVGHHVNAQDILPFENALTNLTGYQSSHGFDVATMYDIFDVNGDQQITGADFQAFLNYLKGGNGSESVPEPSAVVLGLLGAASFAGVAIRRRKAKVAA
jgi:hypothetical protein